MEQKTNPTRFTEALGEDVDSAFKKLAAEILKDGALSLKEKSLIAVACAIAVGCDQCTRVHKKQALKLGATPDEIIEAGGVAGLVRMGSGFNTAYLLLDDYNFRKMVSRKKTDEKEQGPETAKKLSPVLDEGKSNQTPEKEADLKGYQPYFLKNIDQNKKQDNTEK